MNEITLAAASVDPAALVGTAFEGILPGIIGLAGTGLAIFLIVFGLPLAKKVLRKSAS